MPVPRAASPSAPHRAARAAWLALSCATLAFVLGCAGFGRADVATGEDPVARLLPHVGGEAPTSLPAPPFPLTRPDPYGARQVSLPEGADAATAYARADEAFAASDLTAGTALLDAATRLDAQPVRGFELARRLASLGEIDAAFYWLATTATDYGLHAEWLTLYPEFAPLWEDARWHDFAVWLIKTNRYYSNRPAPTPWLVLPDGHEAGRALPVVVWFPANGQRDPFAVWAPQVSNELGVALVAIRGNVPVGPEEAVWSGDADDDGEYVRSVIREIWNTVKPEGRRIIATGSGRGGQYAVELAAREPTLVAGAVALWPSEDLEGAGSKHDRKATTPRRVVLVAGASRDPSAHTLMRQDKGRLARLGDTVQMNIDEQPWEGRLPPNFPEPYIRWLDYVLTGETAPW